MKEKNLGDEEFFVWIIKWKRKDLEGRDLIDDFY